MQVDDCLFCKMARNEIAVDKVYENDELFVIHDIHPKAEVHQLIIFKEHYVNFMDPAISTQAGLQGLQALVNALPVLVEKDNLAKRGLRLVQNNGENAGQSVMHIHFHFLSDPKYRDQL